MSLAAGIAEGDVVETDALLQCQRGGDGMGWVHHFGTKRQKLEQIPQRETVGVNLPRDGKTLQGRRSGVQSVVAGRPNRKSWSEAPRP
jgi:hypothetical protein